MNPQRRIHFGFAFALTKTGRQSTDAAEPTQSSGVEAQSDPEAYDRKGEEVTEEVDVVPMKFVRRLIVRP